MVTVLVNVVRVRVLTEDGQTLPVQLSAQWSSASQMSAEVFEVSYSFGAAGLHSEKLAYHLHSRSVCAGFFQHTELLCSQKDSDSTQSPT